MFDYRYHALSLAAVLLALTVGILLGVAIGDSNLVSSAKDGIVRNLRADVRGAQSQSAGLQRQIAARNTFENDIYPVAVGGQLPGKNIGLIFLGNVSDEINRAVRDSLNNTGGHLAFVAQVREPLDLGGLARLASGSRYTALESNPALVSSFGMRMGVQLVDGGALLGRVRERLLSSLSGSLGKLDGVVIAESSKHLNNPDQAKSVSDLETGLVSGMSAANVPPIGVELSSTDPSQVPWYRSQSLTSVDDLDDIAGRAALVYALAGARGAFGTKPTADSLLPHVVGTPGNPGGP